MNQLINFFNLFTITRFLEGVICANVLHQNIALRYAMISGELKIIGK